MGTNGTACSSRKPKRGEPRYVSLVVRLQGMSAVFMFEHKSMIVQRGAKTLAPMSYLFGWQTGNKKNDTYDLSHGLADAKVEPTCHV